MSAWWEGIRTGYLAHGNDSNAKLKAEFPDSRSLRIRGYGYRFDNTVFLPSIELGNLPVIRQDITLITTSGDPLTESSHRCRSIQQETSEVIELASDDLSKRSVLSGSLPINEDRFGHQPRIQRISRTEGNRHPQYKAIPKSVTSITGSMADILPGASLPHMETLPASPIDLREPFPSKPGFQKICAAMEHLQKQGLVWDRLIQYGRRGYDYAAITGASSSGSFLILEFSDQTPGVSTLIIKNAITPEGNTALSSLLLSSWEAAGCHWKKADLDAFGISYSLLRHSAERSPFRMAELLLNKLQTT